LRNATTKISLFILIGLIISSCNITKRVPDGKHLLVKNDIAVNGTISKDEDVINLAYQKPNTSLPLIKFHLRLTMYNLANLNPDTTYRAKFIKNPEKYKRKAKWLSKKQVDRLGKSFWYHGIHDFLKRTGEAPVIIDELRTKRTILRLQSYYYNKGFFDVKASYKIDTLANKKAKIRYDVITGSPYIFDTIKTKIKTPALDSIYQKNKANSYLKQQQYKAEDLENERNRITNIYRNNGVFYFQQNYISYDVDTVGLHKKPNLSLIINDRNIRVNDSSKTEPFKVYKISKVNIFTDANSSKLTTKNKDSVDYKNFTLFSSGKLKYRPKAITDAVFITKGSLFSDDKTFSTTNYISNLRTFNYPNIQYVIDPKDSISSSLIANIYLTQKQKYSFKSSVDFTHSNIQDFGISGSGSVSIRNVFRGAETFQVAARGNVGSSKDLANPDKQFFNISEIGLDFKLTFPRIFLPFKTEKIIPKSMIPSTSVNVGFAKQRNIGLDKENFTSSIVYNWTPRKNTSMRFDLVNVQFVKNINTANYFNVYKSSYDRLNAIAQQYPTNPAYLADNNLIINDGTSAFIADVLSNPNLLNNSDFNTVRSIEERRQRLTENDLIFASSVVYSKTTKTTLEDNNFYTFRTKLESAGNILSLLAKETLQSKNANGSNTVFGVDYAQYLKTELEFIKHWDLRGKKILAMRTFFGIAIPYGNSNNIPFSRSYFAGGSNDNRAWQAYSLGPGKSGALNDFNEANLKFAFSTELRFNIFNKLNGAIFADTGNIWNVLDDIEDDASIFSGIKSLQDIAIGSGFGFRYDFNFFVVRLDLGFKTYDPSYYLDKKWFRDYNFAHTVLNIGINYPF
jgi:outer membrane protein assembly factor BamA